MPPGIIRHYYCPHNSSNQHKMADMKAKMAALAEKVGSRASGPVPRHRSSLSFAPSAATRPPPRRPSRVRPFPLPLWARRTTHVSAPGSQGRARCQEGQEGRCRRRAEEGEEGAQVREEGQEGSFFWSGVSRSPVACKNAWLTRSDTAEEEARQRRQRERELGCPRGRRGLGGGRPCVFPFPRGLYRAGTQITLFVLCSGRA